MRLALPQAAQVHVWHLDLDHPRLDRLAVVLGDDERARAARCRNAATGLRQLRCRGALRQLLGAYLALHPGEIAFRYGRYGKPALSGSPLHFNVAHSERYAVMGFAAQALGVDVEDSDRPGLNVDGMLELVGNADERAALAQLDAGQRNAAFYRCWTHKEAYCKALGLGLQQNLVDLHVGLPTAAGVARIWNRRHAAPRHGRYVYALGAPHPYLASLCIGRHDAAIDVRHYADWCA